MNVARGFDGESAEGVAYCTFARVESLAGLRVLFPGLTFARLGGDDVTFGAEDTASIGCGGEFGGYRVPLPGSCVDSFAESSVFVSVRGDQRLEFREAGETATFACFGTEELGLLHTAMADRGADTKRPVASDLEVG